MADFLSDYFISPILGNGWFNPLNTAVYGVGLVAGVYLVYRLLKGMGIRIDRHFLYAVLPYIFWASTTRVLHDAAFAGALQEPYQSFYSLPIFPTPGSYFITFGLALASLLASLLVQKRFGFDYWKSMAAVGWTLVGINMVLIPWVTAVPLLIVGGLTALFSGAFFLSGRLTRLGKARIRTDLFSRQNNVIMSAHFLDASATAVALSLYGYLEQHVVPRMFIGFMGEPSFMLLKVAVVLPVLWVLDRHVEPGDFRNFLKIVVLILGLAPGLRDAIRLAAGV
jgi:uncharacterized membrane protein